MDGWMDQHAYASTLRVAIAGGDSRVEESGNPAVKIEWRQRNRRFIANNLCPCIATVFFHFEPFCATNQIDPIFLFSS
jgi:hypothetical protein